MNNITKVSGEQTQSVKVPLKGLSTLVLNIMSRLQSPSLLVQIFLKFCQETSLHGWRFLTNGNLRIRQVIFWSLIISISSLVCGVLITLQILEFYKATVVFEIESMSIPMEELYFPSVVVCNKNTLKQSFLRSLMSNDKLGQLTNFDEFTELLIGAYISGSKTHFDTKEQQILNGKNSLKVQ